jgi:hypothetical protein
MSCCIKYHDIAVQNDEKYNFLILLKNISFDLYSLLQIKNKVIFNEA